MLRPVVRTRPAWREDAFDIAEIQIDGWRQTYRDTIAAEVLADLDLMTSAARWEAQIRERQLDVEVALEGDVMLGFVAYGKTRDTDAPNATRELYALYVAPSSQRLGVGSQLLEQVIVKIQQQGAQRLTVWVASSNHNALNFYAKHELLPDGNQRVDTQLASVPISETRCSRSI